MTKQEEIREGMAKKLCLCDALDWEQLPESGYANSKDRAYYRRLAASILQDLHSQGCVLKVDRELPKNPFHELELVDDVYIHRSRKIHRAAQQYMLNAGYVAVEPLIEEKK